MSILQNQETGQWETRKVPSEIAEERARKMMGLDEPDFPNITQQEAYNKMKTDAGLRKEINKAFIKEYKRPATDEEYSNILQQAVGMPFGDLNIKKKPEKASPITMPQGDYRDISLSW